MLRPAAAGVEAEELTAVVFAYHRSLSPMIGVLLALALVEAGVVHLVAMAWWGREVAIPLAVLDAGLLVALVGLLRSFRHRPITLTEGVLTLRTGARLVFAVSVADIAGFRQHWSGEDLKRRTVLNMALASWPNIVIDLKRPIERQRRHITSVAHCIDDPTALRTAVTAAIAATPPVA